jgi:hypothetical protein
MWGLPSAGNGRPAFRKVLRPVGKESRLNIALSTRIRTLSIVKCGGLFRTTKIGSSFFFYNARMRCNHNDLTCQEYVQRITYLSQWARWLYLVEKLSGMGFGEFL